jgi:exo-beta-1,3-glucanase (GH17 family)
VTTCSTTGVYTIPATTVTITQETTVCGATSTPISSSGTYTVGGVTTIVETATTVVCPYATTTSSGGVVTSTILTTTYVCPSAGTYTIAPLTTTVSKSTIWVYPTPASWPAGTYTQSEVVTTVTETDYVFYCPFATSPVRVAAPTTAAPVAPPASKTSTAAAAGATIGSSGNQWGMTYTPYDNNGDCQDASTVASNMKEIAQKGFKVVRVYSTDCSTLQNVGSAAAANGLKMIIGVFISDTGISGAQDQVTQIVSWAQWDLVELIVVGNEAVLNGYATSSALAAFITSSRSAFKAAGYTGQVTTTEPLNIWQANTAELCGVVDIVGCNIHPFFNADTIAAEAGTFVASQLQIVDGLCEGKTGINLETGWPAGGDCDGLACPGVVEQSVAVAAITLEAGGRSVILSFTDDLWQAPGAFNCERTWGAIRLFDLI